MNRVQWYARVVAGPPLLAVTGASNRPRRGHRHGERGLEVLQVVILAAFFAGLALTAAAILKTKVLDTANGTQTR